MTTMKMRARRHTTKRRVSRYERDCAYFEGIKWSRRHRARFALAGPVPPLVFNSIKVSVCFIGSVSV